MDDKWWKGKERFQRAGGGGMINDGESRNTPHSIPHSIYWIISKVYIHSSVAYELRHLHDAVHFVNGEVTQGTVTCPPAWDYA
jgi:hypothetical protein